MSEAMNYYMNVLGMSEDEARLEAGHVVVEQFLEAELGE